MYGAAVSFIRSRLGLGTYVKDEEPVRERSPVVVERQVVVQAPPPDLTGLKGEILDEIKMYFEECK